MTDHAAHAGTDHLLDAEARDEHRRRNLIHSVLLIAAIGLVLAIASFMIFGLSGVLMSFIAIGALAFLAPQLPPDTVMRIYRARKFETPDHPISQVMDELAMRARLERRPDLYVIPSATLNAFATGKPDHSVIGVTEGLLRRLTMREITGVLAHEMSHIRNNDVWLMGLADVMSRFVQALSYTAVFLAVFNIVGTLAGEPPVPWFAIILLYFAPTISSLLQLGLSRAREFDADLEAAVLTGDPTGLASALQRLENQTGHFWEDMMMPVPARRVPVPSLLRTHPPTQERVDRLLVLRPGQTMPPVVVREEPMTTMIGMGPIQMRPRYRFPGIWY